MSFFEKFLKTLFLVLFLAGYLSIIVIASIMTKGSNPGLGHAIAVIALAMGAVLGLGLVFVERRQKRAVKHRGQTAAHAAMAPPATPAAQESQTFEHAVETVWELIRPAESAVLLGNAQRAFTVPGTPGGVGEQQCFIGGDGSVSIIEVVGEECPRWATTRVISPAEGEVRQTYELEPTSRGCSLRIGVLLEAQTTDEALKQYEQSWRGHTRQYLARVAQVLEMKHGGAP